MKTKEEILLKYTIAKTVKGLLKIKETKYVRISTALEAMEEYAQQQANDAQSKDGKLPITLVSGSLPVELIDISISQRADDYTLKEVSVEDDIDALFVYGQNDRTDIIQDWIDNKLHNAFESGAKWVRKKLLGQ